MAGNDVEQIKDQSRSLRGTIEGTLRSDATHFTPEDYQLLKFHGTYQQDDRDLRIQRKKEGLDKAWSFMVRTKMPGGCITSEQYLAMDRLAGEIGNNTLRITTRQGIQFHGILKKNLKECMVRIHQSGITTWGACGDVVRNTVGPTSPLNTPAHVDAQKLAKELSDTFLAHSHAYTEIWIDGKRSGGDTAAEEETIYGKHYLPRKFKIGLAIPPRNDIDVYTQDIGFVSHAPSGQVEGYTVLVGGGFGMSHGLVKTHPILAQPLFYIRREHVVAAAIAIVTVQRDHGNREDRKLSRLKYLIEARGIDWFRKEVESRLKAPTEPPKSFEFTTVSDMLGWHEQGDGRLFCCISVENGRIQDAGSLRYRSAFRAIATKFGFPIRCTPNCNLLFHQIDPSQRPEVERILADHGIPDPASLTEARKTSHACVALPTCGLALSESERVFSGVMDEIDTILRELKLEKEPILIRMSGCPNGCPRPYNADIAFVGRAPDKYALFIGGSIAGDRLVGLERKMVERKDISKVLRAYLEEFAANRKQGERFTEYWGRTHPAGPQPVPEQFHVELAERAARLAGVGSSPSAD